MRFFPLSLLLIVLCGCAHYPLNAPLEQIDLEAGYRLREACDAHADRTCMNLAGMKSCHSSARSSCYAELQVADDTRPTELDIYIIHISFDLIDDQQRRYRYQSIPTALQLPREDVDALIEVIPELTMEDPEFRHLLQDLKAEVVIET